MTKPDAKSETIAILDFGSQYAQLIARRVRENGVYSVLVRPDVPPDELRQMNLKGLIFTGGPAGVYERDAPKCRPEILELPVPILGICYGMQVAAQLLGAEVKPGGSGEVEFQVPVSVFGGRRGLPGVGRQWRDGLCIQGAGLIAGVGPLGVHQLQ